MVVQKRFRLQNGETITLFMYTSLNSSVSQTPEANGLAEKCNRILIRIEI